MLLLLSADMSQQPSMDLTANQSIESQRTSGPELLSAFTGAARVLQQPNSFFLSILELRSDLQLLRQLHLTEDLPVRARSQ